MISQLRLLRRLYVIGSIVLVMLLYLLYGGVRRSDPLLMLEATFAWLAVFLPPLFILERSYALGRILLRRAGAPVAAHRRG